MQEVDGQGYCIAISGIWKNSSVWVGSWHEKQIHKRPLRNKKICFWEPPWDVARI
jgi:hypothetical protein